MSKVIVDNWSIESTLNYVSCFYDKEVMPYSDMLTCWNDFLTTIVLWDEIYFHNNDYAQFWQNYTSKIEQSNNEKIEDAVDKISALIKPLDTDMNSPQFSPEVSDLFQIPPYYSSSNDNDILNRASYYLLLSNLYNISYMPHPKRSQFIYNNNIHVKLFSRIDIINKIDDDILEYYNSINQTLKRKFLNFEYPLFYDYIRHYAESNDANDILNAAFFLRNDPDIIYFKNSIDNLEITINNGNTQALLSVLKEISEISRKITKRHEKKLYLGELSIGLSPSIKIPLSKKISRKLLHTTFIRNLINYSVNER